MSVLTLVATPIGNLGDLSPRAVEALAAADVVACETPAELAGCCNTLEWTAYG